MKTYINPQRSDWKALCTRPAVNKQDLNALIKDIFFAVETRGDQALMEYCKMFEAAVPQQFALPADTIAALAEEVSEGLQDAIIQARDNIWKFHEQQAQPVTKVTVQNGVECWQKQVPIESVGLYIPGGSAPLFSTVLMLAIPAKIAGVSKINLFTPPNAEGRIHPAIAFAAQLIGVDAIYTLGGAQAIAAATLGTDQIPQCDKIFGPGNQYVTAAKMYAQQLGVAIDMPAGPSEVLVWADDAANPQFVAADLLSQAEHGADSQCVLLAQSEAFVGKVNAAIAEQLAQLPRKDIATQALENSVAVVLDNAESVEFCNTYAPEHLIIQTENAEQLIDHIVNAGSVFVGAFSPESAGDYASGTNHTLPTAGFARAYSGVNLASFCKQITFQQLSKEGLNALATSVITMAESEGLQAHANAVKIRLENGN